MMTFRLALLRTVLCFAALLGAWRPANGQVRQGDTVRVRTVDGAQYRGVLVSNDSGRLVLRGTGTDGISVRLDSIRSAETLRGRQRLGWRAVGWGAAIGAAAGLLYAPIAKRHDDAANQGTGGFDILPSTLAFYEAVVGATGALAGAGVGGIVSGVRVERWSRIADPGLRSARATVPEGGGLRLVVTLGRPARAP